MMEREEWPRESIAATTAAPDPISIVFAFMKTRDTGGQGTRSASSIPRPDGKRGRRPRMTLAGSVQVLVLFIFACVPRSLPTPVSATSVSVRLNSLRLAGRPVRMSLRKFHLECLQSVVYRCRAEATVHHLIPKAIFHTYGPALQGRSRR
jgi:hypothetical protein